MGQERLNAPQQTKSEREALEERIRLLEEQKYLEENLPHLYGWPWYQWAWDYFQSTNRYNFLVAANQASKSSTQIRKCIHWATETTLWPKLWSRKPTQFWYLYPSLEVASSEWEEKWVKEFMPREALKDHPKYGWKEEWKQGKIHRILFNTGVTVYFRSYEQDVSNLQTSSVFAIFCDEELPVHLYSELNARISAATVRGYWHMCFTATLGQTMWRLTMEEKGTQHELFKNAFKLNVSLYDCKQYMDGTPGPWTDEMIDEVKESCATDAEVQRRVYGRFVVDADLKYPSFSRKLNTKPGHMLPKNWLIWAGIDYGSGGANGHPAGIAFVATNQEFTKGRVFKAWRGDKIQTDAGAIIEKYLELRGKMKPVGEFYDHQCRDLYTIATSRKPAIPLQKAEKGQDTGSTLLNTLFKQQMLELYSDDDEVMKAVIEFESVKTTTPKQKAQDDLIDAIRFAVTKIPWDFTKAKKTKGKEKEEPKTERERYWAEQRDKKLGIDLIEADIDLANEAFDYQGDDGFGGFIDD